MFHSEVFPVLVMTVGHLAAGKKNTKADANGNILAVMLGVQGPSLRYNHLDGAGPLDVHARVDD